MKVEYTKEDIDRGLAWYADHKDHVLRLIGTPDNYLNEAYPMSGSDISHPELWKPGAWRWLLAKVWLKDFPGSKK